LVTFCLQAAIKLCEILLSVASTNHITAESIQADRRTQRMDLDWPCSEAVPDGQPKPAEDQAGTYRSIATRSLEALMAADQNHTPQAASTFWPTIDGDLVSDEDAAEVLGDNWLSHRSASPAARASSSQEGSQQAAAVAGSHPSLQFFKGWLLFKAGSRHDLLFALSCFTAAAAHPHLRSSCCMLRGLCLLHLEKLEAAKQELTAGLELDAAANSPGGKAEPSLLIDAHSALAVIAARTAFSIPANSSSTAAPGNSRSHSGSSSSGTVPVRRDQGSPSGEHAAPAVAAAAAHDSAATAPMDSADTADTAVPASEGSPTEAESHLQQFIRAELLQQAVQSFRLATQAAEAYGEVMYAQRMKELGGAVTNEGGALPDAGVEQLFLPDWIKKRTWEAAMAVSCKQAHSLRQVHVGLWDGFMTRELWETTCISANLSSWQLACGTTVACHLHELH
jgi:hypothetical protein